MTFITSAIFFLLSYSNTGIHQKLYVSTLKLILFLHVAAHGGCYFPVEVQGEYVTQSMIDSEIAYTSVTITYDSIPGKGTTITSLKQDVSFSLSGWGDCYSRHGLRGHHHVLQDVTVNGDSCYKCVKIQVIMIILILFFISPSPPTP